jgi:RNA polymerase sigma-70 factor (ECF subfamily)
MTNATRIYEQNDAFLMQLINTNNDYKAFEQLFHRHYSRLCRYVLTLTQSADVAEEIVSDVFLKIWQKRDVLEIKSSVNAYLTTATRNLAIDHLRRVARHRNRVEELAGDYQGDYASPSESVIGSETHDIIEAAIDSMPPQCKLIFRMSRDSGMTYPEIAATLNLSIKTIETHMGRSLKFLRESLRRQAVLA